MEKKIESYYSDGFRLPRISQFSIGRMEYPLLDRASLFMDDSLLFYLRK